MLNLWIISGEFQIGDNIKPLDPKAVSSIVYYGTSEDELVHEARGHSLIYNQLYPFEGLQNYTSGIIHHVQLKGEIYGFRLERKKWIHLTLHPFFDTILLYISLFLFSFLNSLTVYL